MSDYSEVEGEELRKLFIGGLNYESTVESLKSHFEQWGQVVDCVVVQHRVTGRSRGFGFVTFKRAHMVDDVQAQRPHRIDGRLVEPRRAVPREDCGKPESLIRVNKLFIGSITDDFEKKDFLDYFGEYGTIVSVDIVTSRFTGKNYGYAFVKFDDHDPVDKAVLREHTIRGKRVQVKKGFSRHQLEKIKMEYFNRRGSSGRSRDGGGNDSYDNYGGASTSADGGASTSADGGNDSYDNYGGGGNDSYDNYGGGGNDSYDNYGGGGNDSYDNYGGGGNDRWAPMHSSGDSSGRSQGPYDGGARSGGYSSYGR